MPPDFDDISLKGEGNVDQNPMHKSPSNILSEFIINSKVISINILKDNSTMNKT